MAKFMVKVTYGDGTTVYSGRYRGMAGVTKLDRGWTEKFGFSSKEEAEERCKELNARDTDPIVKAFIPEVREWIEEAIKTAKYAVVEVK